MLSAEAIQQIEKTAQQAHTPQPVHATPRSSTYAVNGQLHTLPLEPPPRRHVVHGPHDLVEFLRHWPDLSRASVWHYDDAIVAMLDGDDRLDLVRCPLPFSDPWDRVRQLPRSFDQQALVAFLRLEMGLDPVLVAPWRRLAWSAGRSTDGTVEHGRDRLGKDIEAKVTGVDDLPDEVTIPVPVYTIGNLSTPQPIRCRVQFQPAQETVVLAPLPLEVERTMEIMQATIHNRLVVDLRDLDVEVPVYHGYPLPKQN